MNGYSPNNSFFVKLFRGEYSLARTYWLYCGLPVTIFAKIISIIEPLKFFIPLFFTLVLYHTIAIVGVWRAANKYKGLKIWTYLAKSVCVMACLFNILYSLFIFSLIDEVYIKDIIHNESNNTGVISSIKNVDDMSEGLKSYDDCILHFSKDSTSDVLPQFVKKCDEYFPVIDIVAEYNQEMFSYNWYYDFWNIYVTIENRNPKLLIVGCYANVKGANPCNETDFKLVDMYFPFSPGNETSSIVTLEDTSLFKYLNILKVHYRDRASK